MLFINLKKSEIPIIGARAGGGGMVAQGEQLPSPKKKRKKMNVFGQKIDAIRVKINRTNFIFSKRVILIISETNITYFSSLIKHRGHFFPLKETVCYINCNRNTIKDIPHIGLCLFPDV